MNREILKKVRPPQPGDIFYINSRHIYMEDKLNDKQMRPCVVLCNCSLTTPPCESVFIVPFSSIGEEDKYRFPVRDGFEQINEKFNPAKKCFALLNLYQPVLIDAFHEKCARLECNTYLALKETIANSILGYSEIDFDIDIS